MPAPGLEEDFVVGVNTAPPHPGGAVFGVAAVEVGVGEMVDVAAEDGKLPKLDCCGTKGGRPLEEVLLNAIFDGEEAFDRPKLVAGSRLIL